MEDSCSDVGAWTSRQIAGIFVQQGFGEELTCPLGCLRCDGAPVQSSKSARSVGPLAGVVFRRVRHAESGSHGRK